MSGEQTVTIAILDNFIFPLLVILIGHYIIKYMDSLIFRKDQDFWINCLKQSNDIIKQYLQEVEEKIYLKTHYTLVGFLSGYWIPAVFLGFYTLYILKSSIIEVRLMWQFLCICIVLLSLMVYILSLSYHKAMNVKTSKVLKIYNIADKFNLGLLFCTIVMLIPSVLSVKISCKNCSYINDIFIPNILPKFSVIIFVIGVIGYLLKDEVKKIRPIILSQIKNKYQKQIPEICVVTKFGKFTGKLKEISNALYLEDESTIYIVKWNDILLIKIIK